MKLITLLLFILMVGCGESSLDEGDLVQGGDSTPTTDTDDGGDDDPDPVYGDVSGTITDGRTGSAISGATVAISGTSHTTTTDGSGNYSFTNVEVASYTVNISEASYMSQGITYEIEEGSDNTLNASLLTSAYASNKVTIILAWDDAPADLDSHLYVPTDAPTSTEVYYAARGDTDNNDMDVAPYAALDVDDTDGDGPETITIGYSGGTTDYPRNYRYFIRNFSNASGNEIGLSNATVRVYKNGVLSNSFNVTKSATDVWWHVFDMDQNGTITEVNTYSSTKPSPIY